MRRQDQISSRANIVPQMAVSSYLARRHVPKRLTKIWISKKHDRVNEVGLTSGYDFGGIVSDLSTLTISTDHKLCRWALIHGLSDQLCQVLATRGTSSCQEPLDIGWVHVYPLDGDLGCAKLFVESSDEWRAYDAPNVALFGCTTGEEQGQVLAGAADQVIASRSGEINIDAIGGKGSRRHAAEATAIVLGMSRMSGDRGSPDETRGADGEV